MSTHRDRRYGTAFWQRVRLRVLNRDNWVCRVVEGCPERATVADHIIAVYPGMPDGQFFTLSNLRASCRAHNLARGFAATLETEDQPSAVITKDYSG